jgi:hypothetical protein
MILPQHKQNSNPAAFTQPILVAVPVIKLTAKESAKDISRLAQRCMAVAFVQSFYNVPVDYVNRVNMSVKRI